MIITFDVETYYDQDYSLRKLSEVEYVLDHRYQTIMAAIQVGDGPCEAYVGHAAIADKLATIDWEHAALLSHNTRFDGAILAWRFGYTPALYLDTLSMARALTHAVVGRSSLAKVADYLGFPAKGDAVVRAMGKRLENFAPVELEEYAEYCVHDAELCRAIFDKFMTVFPKSELRVVDLFLRMFISPQAKLNPHKLAVNLAAVRAEKAQALARVSHIPKDVFSSNAKFANLLRDHGVDVPMKISPVTGEEIPALARQDRAFKELVADETQTITVQALLAARMGAKSTIEETRTATLLNLSLRNWGENNTGWMPVPYRYYGAHTGRPSGDGGFNFANLRRGSPIRDAIEAPAGYRVVHRDSSQIEARMVAWLAGCDTLLTAFAQGRDIYSEFASMFYRRHITKADVPARFCGKTCVLGLGYGTGWEKLRHTLFIGNGGISVDLAEEDAKTLVYLYRNTYPEIPGLWRRAEQLLERMIEGNQPYVPGRFVAELYTDLPRLPVVVEGRDAIWLPNGLCVAYPQIRTDRTPDGRNQMFYTGPYQEARKIYGAKCVENLSQALARIVVTDIMLRVHASTKYHPFMMTYDSLEYLVPESDAADMNNLLEAEFAQRPTWAGTLPLASEGGWGNTLSEAEKGLNR